MEEKIEYHFVHPEKRKRIMLVKIVKYWPENTSQMRLEVSVNLTRQSPNYSLKWEDLEFTFDEVDECDLLIVLGFVPKNLEIKARQAWVLQQEPPMEDLWGWQKKSYKYFDKIFGFWDEENITNEQTSLTWFINKSYDELSNIQITEKQDRVSFCTSNLYERPGHIVRIDFKNYLEKTGFDFDLFGNGFNPINDKYNALNPYKYSIAIENYFTEGYWTEKIADCFLCNTMPIYCGAKDILKYFPKESLILIDPYKKQESYEIIKDAIENKAWDKNIEYIKEAKDLCLNKYQLFPNLKRLFDEHKVMESSMKTYKIPKTKTYASKLLEYARHKPLKAIAILAQGKERYYNTISI